jgi:hypothetical protein
LPPAPRSELARAAAPRRPERSYRQKAASLGLLEEAAQRCPAQWRARVRPERVRAVQVRHGSALTDVRVNLLASARSALCRTAE